MKPNRKERNKMDVDKEKVEKIVVDMNRINEELSQQRIQK